jgi:hypothetical protein
MTAVAAATAAVIAAAADAGDDSICTYADRRVYCPDSMFKYFCALFLLLACVAGCAPKPGPAERLGKSLDEIASDISDMSDDWEKEHRERDAERRHDDRDSYYARPTPDPYQYDIYGNKRPEPEHY